MDEDDDGEDDDDTMRCDAVTQRSNDKTVITELHRIILSMGSVDHQCS